MLTVRHLKYVLGPLTNWYAFRFATSWPCCQYQSCTQREHYFLHSITRKVLATVKVIRADIADYGKPSNTLLHNLTAHVNLYTEEEATVGHIMLKVREEMGNENLILVGTNGLTIYDQEGTRGNLNFLSGIEFSEFSSLLNLNFLNVIPIPVLKFYTCNIIFLI